MIENAGEEITNSKRIFGLDLMRALAIIAVLSSHILWIYPPQKNILSQFCVLFGFLGVEMFFVLSGFLIGSILYHLYIKEDFSLKTVFFFLKRRWFRTLPNYYLFLIINGLVAFYIGHSLADFWKYVFFLQNAVSTMLPFFAESWSLSIEEYTYLLLPFALFFSALIIRPKERKNSFLLIVMSLILFFIASKFFYNFTTSNTTLIQWNVSLKAVVLYRIDSILVGVAFSWLYINFNEVWRKFKWLFACVGVLLFVVMYAGVGYFRILIDNYPMFWNVFYLPITSVTIAMFLPLLSQWKTTKWRIKSLVVMFSLISYSVYLIHYGFVLQLMKYLLPTKALSMPMLHLYAFVFLIITFGLSYLNYHYFEKPMTNLREKSFDKENQN